MYKYAVLTPEQLVVLRDKGTEQPFSSDLQNVVKQGTYLCRGCGHALFRGTHQFQASCGWPSFDDEIIDAIKRQLDADGRRIEIVCNHCNGHLGHVFYQEGLTVKNLRHCVNAIALEWVADNTILESEEGIFAAGCFWGVEYLLQKQLGVLKTEVGYTGGHALYPSYGQVCDGHTGHVEAVRVVFDPQQISYAELVKFFFEIHDPTQMDGQGPDKGAQYASEIFCFDMTQKQIAEAVKKVLLNKECAVITKIRDVHVFWAAEKYHQNYYEKTGKTPYCHFHHKKF